MGKPPHFKLYQNERFWPYPSQIFWCQTQTWFHFFFLFFLLQPLKFSFMCKFGISFVVGVLYCCQWDKVGSSPQPYTCVILFWCLMPLPLVAAWGNELRRLNCTLSFIVYSLLYQFYMYQFSVGWNIFSAWCYGNKGTWVQTLCDGLRVRLRSIFASSAGSGAPQSPRTRQSWACTLSEDSFWDIFEGSWMLEVWKMHMKTRCLYLSLALFLSKAWSAASQGQGEDFHCLWWVSHLAQVMRCWETFACSWCLHSGEELDSAFQRGSGSGAWEPVLREKAWLQLCC